MLLKLLLNQSKFRSTFEFSIYQNIPKYFIFWATGDARCVSHTTNPSPYSKCFPGVNWQCCPNFQLAKVCNAQSCALCPLLWLQQSFPAILACKGSLSLIVQVVTGFLNADCNRLHYGYVAGLSHPEFCTRDRNQSVIRAKSDILFCFVIWKCVFSCFVINVIIFDATYLLVTLLSFVVVSSILR